MARNESSVIVGVFKERQQAEHAYNDLRSAGFGQDYVGFAQHGTGEVNFRKHLMGAGVPEDEANFYDQEFQQGRRIVTVRVGGLTQDSIQKAINILKRDGAYDANSQYEQEFDLGSNVKTDESPPYFDINAGSNPGTGSNKLS